MYRKLTPKEKEEQINKLKEVGAFLRGLRTGRNLKLATVAQEVGVSSMFLSEVETGKKPPGDEVIRSLATFYDISEKELFSMYGKVSLSVVEELQENEDLHTTLSKIASSRLTDTQKNKLYERLLELYIEEENKT